MKIDFSRYYELLNEVFWDFFDDINSKIKISIGGSGSGKSIEAFQECIYKLITQPGHNYLICRKVAATNKVSTFSLFQQLTSNLASNQKDDVENINISRLFKVNKSDMTITCRNNGNQVVFKGLDDIEKIKSITFPSGVLTDILVEEASEITQGDFDQLLIRLRGLSRVPKQITLLLNPIHDKHWIKREFFDLKSYQKKNKVRILRTTYLDNDFLDDDYRETLESYKEINYEFYRVYCLGEWGSFGNVIFNNYEFGVCPYKEEDFDAVYIGQDFGFNHPQVIVKIGFKDGVMYTFKELCCFEKTNKEIIDVNKELEILLPGQRVICDSAEPAKIQEWRQYGYGALPAIKGKGSVKRGIDFIKSMRWIIDDSKCPRTAQEVQTYSWKKDKKSDAIIDEPVDLFDDAIKAHMYALEELANSKLKPSTLSGKISDHKKELIMAKKEERKNKKEILKKQKEDLRMQRKKLREEKRENR